MSRVVSTPFVLQLSALKGFFEIPFSGHSVYHSLEVQIWGLPEGDQMLVLMTQLSGTVDVFHPLTLDLDEQWFHGEAATALHKSGDLVPTTFRTLRFSIDADGLNAEVDFDDAHGHSVWLTARDPFQADSETFSVFTPAPFRSEPALLRFLSMRRLAFCKRASAQFDLRIDGSPMNPVTLPGSRFLPLPMRGSLRYSARYCADLLLASLNADTEGRCVRIGTEADIIHAVSKSDSQSVWLTGDDFDTLISVGANGNPMILAQRCAHQGETLLMSFEAPFPALIETCSGENSVGEGVFCMTAGEESVCTGRYEFAQESGKLTLNLVNVIQEWLPARLTLSVRLLLWLRKFKRRGQQYRLNAVVKGDEMCEPMLVSKWIGTN